MLPGVSQIRQHRPLHSYHRLSEYWHPPQQGVANPLFRALVIRSCYHKLSIGMQHISYFLARQANRTDGETWYIRNIGIPSDWVEGFMKRLANQVKLWPVGQTVWNGDVTWEGTQAVQEPNSSGRQLSVKTSKPGHCPKWQPLKVWKAAVTLLIASIGNGTQAQNQNPSTCTGGTSGNIGFCIDPVNGTQVNRCRLHDYVLETSQNGFRDGLVQKSPSICLMDRTLAVSQIQGGRLRLVSVDTGKMEWDFVSTVRIIRFKCCVTNFLNLHTTRCIVQPTQTYHLITSEDLICLQCCLVMRGWTMIYLCLLPLHCVTDGAFV
jgi:hypothetical protein